MAGMPGSAKTVVGANNLLKITAAPPAPTGKPTATTTPNSPFDAIVVGEYERAFYRSQFSLMVPLLEHYGVQLWMQEARGCVDFQSEGHEQLMIALGVQSKREVTRTRIRVLTAMAAQVRVQGRYLGGRPPYGYRLAAWR